MGKRLEISDMPPLTVEMHEELRRLERELQNALDSCCSSHELLDKHAAFEYARTYAVKFYDCFYSFYSRVPDETYRPHWRPASETFAFNRVVQCIENNLSVSRYFAADTTRVERIKRTISDQAKKQPILERVPSLASAYAASGVDIASGSPLLKMVAAASTSSHLQPPNAPSVWAPVPPAPRQRIGRSLHSEKAAQRMEAYIQTKGITQTQFSVAVDADPKTLYRFRKTGKVEKSVAIRIANAMGITLEQFTD